MLSDSEIFAIEEIVTLVYDKEEIKARVDEAIALILCTDKWAKYFLKMGKSCRRYYVSIYFSLES